jgi:hypothetical protein
MWVLEKKGGNRDAEEAAGYCEGKIRHIPCDEG